MNNSFRLRRMRMMDDRRAPEFAKIVARCLIVRALRRASLRYALYGQPCMIAFVLPLASDADIFVEAAQDILRSRCRSRDRGAADYKVVYWNKPKPVRKPSVPDTNLREMLAENRVFVFVSEMESLSPSVRSALDGIVEMATPDNDVLKMAARAITKRTVPDDVISAVAGEPLSLLNEVFKPNRDPAPIVRRLARARDVGPDQRHIRSAVEQPTLDDLHGLGEAAVWGRELAKDLADFREGLLPWADVDRGVLVSGPTGTGKTTFAQALARTCNVPIHIHSLARWQARGYLNDLLKAMRAAFDEARKAAPCVLFVDEVDSFGDRETLDGKNEQYCREVINAFLECLDGIEGREGVVVVGASNLPGKIDKAILRPGRLGKHVRIPLPDAEARIGILRHHLRGELASEDIKAVAIRLEGASGAVIEQAVRDARRKARSERRPMVIADLQHGLPIRIVQSERAFLRACVHEAGHAVVGHLLGIESGSRLVETQVFREVLQDGSGGKTAFCHMPGLDRGKAAYLAQITILLAGIAAENAIFGHHAEGGGGEDDSDLHQATLIAATMEISLGLGESLVYLSSRHPAAVLSRVRLDAPLRHRVSKVLTECFERAKALVGERATSFNAVVRVLQENGHASAHDIERLVGAGGNTSDFRQSVTGSVTADEASSDRGFRGSG
ncbi:AAA family ATPase [Afipia carboxidovorans]|uniref:AAA family ATPase n=1 Tax=Afipia carboxidovorans TaxID=40137 RepID=UPI0030CD4F16